MSIIMKCHGSAHGDLTYAGQYLKSFDHEAFDGQGEIVMTRDISQAKRFSDLVEAWEFWKRQPKCKPMRDYGDFGPNRPLTASTWEFVTVQEPANA